MIVRKLSSCGKQRVVKGISNQMRIVLSHIAVFSYVIAKKKSKSVVTVVIIAWNINLAVEPNSHFNTEVEKNLD